MATKRTGLLAVWTDVEPAAEADFNEWYDREHLAERAANAGFLNARRYQSAQAEPRYFAAYDTRSLAVLGSPAYLKALANQTAWSRRVLPRMRNTTRMIAALAADRGTGLGGAMLTVRLAPGAAGAAPLAEALERDLLDSLAALPGVVRVSVALGVVAGLEMDTRLPPRLAAERPDAVALLVEGTELAPLAGVSAGPLRDDALLAAGASAVLQRGLYRMSKTVLA